MAQLTKTEFDIQTAVLFPTNGVGAISALDLRTQINNMSDSVPFKTTGATFPPVATDDGANTSGRGAIEVGDVWVDETNGIAYICVDNTTNAAVWESITGGGGGGGGGGASALRATGYATRAAFVTANTGTPGLGSADGQIVRAAGLEYRRLAASTAISDLAGWVPNGDVTPQHFGALTRANDSGVDQSSKVQAAMDYCGAAVVPLYLDAMYLVNGVQQVSNLAVYGRGGGFVTLSFTVSAPVSGYTTGARHTVTSDRKANFIWDGVIFDASLNTNFGGGNRILGIFESTDYEVRNCHFITQGAATASLNCSNYIIRDNYVLAQGLYGVLGVPEALHDGVIDQWSGSNNFQILNNIIETGNTTPRWPILVTGTDTGNNPTRVYDGQIVGNKVVGYTQAGIWVMGRSGNSDGFIISENQVYGNTATAFMGIGASEITGCVIANNYIKDASANGIRVYTESVSFTPDQTGVIVTGNVIVNANAGAYPEIVEASAILIRSDTTFCFVGGNTVTGTAHRWALYLANSDAALANISLGPNAFQTGTSGIVGVSGDIPGLSGFSAEGTEARIYANGGLRFRVTGSSASVRGAATETQALTVGEGRTGDGRSEVNLISTSSGSAVSFTAYAGANGIREIRSNGTGPLQLVSNAAAPILLNTTNIERVRILADGRVGIGNTGTMASGAFVDMTSTTGGLAIPRMTTAQRDAITSPADGILIYNTTTVTVQVRAGGAWVSL